MRTDHKITLSWKKVPSMHPQTTGKTFSNINLLLRFARYGGLWLFMLWAISCAKPVQHDENLAAKRALEFARVVLIDKNLERGYDLLSDSGKRHVPIDKFKQTILSMNARGYPSRVTATDYEPMPGEQAIYIFLRGQTGDEQVQYRITLEGTAAAGYKVLKIDQGSGFPSLSNQKHKFETTWSAP
jgi:hypothetical protein